MDAVYPVVFIDAINVQIRDGQIANRPIYVALAVTCDGERDVLGLWAGKHGTFRDFRCLAPALQHPDTGMAAVVVWSALGDVPERPFSSTSAADLMVIQREPRRREDHLMSATRRRVRGALALAVAATALAAAPAGPVAAAPLDGREVTLLSLPAGVKTGRAWDINNHGQVAGGAGGKAAIWSADGRITLLRQVAGYPYSVAFGINDAGVAVGQISTEPYDGERAVRWNIDGSVTLLAPNDAGTTGAYALNERGDIVGWAIPKPAANGRIDPAYPVRFVNSIAQRVGGFVSGWTEAISDDTPVTLTGSFQPRQSDGSWGIGHGFQLRDEPHPRPSIVLPGAEAGGLTISRDGRRIAGYTDDKFAIWNREYDPAARQDRWVLRMTGQLAAGAGTWAEGMNGAGTLVVGSAELTGGRRAFIIENGTLKALPGEYASATDVNDSGVVAGWISLEHTGDKVVPAVWK